MIKDTTLSREREQDVLHSYYKEYFTKMFKLKLENCMSTMWKIINRIKDIE